MIRAFRDVFSIAMMMILMIQPILSTPISQRDITIKINQKPIQTDTAIIQKNKTLFLPLQDTFSIIDGHLRFERWDNSYKFHDRKQNLSAIIIPHSRELWVGDRQLFLEEAPILYENRLYVPVVNFFSYLGYQVNQTGQTIDIHTEKKKQSTTVTQRKTKENLLSSTDDPNTTITHEIHLPQVTHYNSLFLSFGEDLYDLSQKTFYKNDILFVDLTEVFNNENIKVRKDTTTITLQVHKTLITLDKNSRKVIKKHKNNTATQFLEHAPIIKNGRIYYPFKSLIAAMDLAINWQARDRKIIVLNKIKTINVIKNGNKTQVQVLATLPIESNDIDIEKKASGYVINIPYSRNFAKKQRLQIKTSEISEIYSKNSGDTDSKIHIQLRKKSAFPMVKRDTTGAIISFHTTIQKIEEKRSDQASTIIIKGTSAFDAPFVQTFTNPDRLIIDIPGSVSELPLVIRKSSPAYHKIRSSQYKSYPPKTRVVIDLKKGYQSPKTQHLGKTFKITFPHPKKGSTSIAKPKPSRSGSLKNKVIAIDPGHGGRDPGAIGKNKDYEKKYTLDIAKRLKKRLEKEGAYVIMSREKDQNTRLHRRVQIANKNKADIFVSIHINSFFNATARGTETYYYKPKDKALASAIQKELVHSLKLKNNGTKRARLYVLNHSKMPAALVEPLFMTRPAEYKMIKTPETRQKIANALFDGIQNYFKSH